MKRANLTLTSPNSYSLSGLFCFTIWMECLADFASVAYDLLSSFFPILESYRMCQLGEYWRCEEQIASVCKYFVLDSQ